MRYRLKTRLTLLKENIEAELIKQNPSIDNILDSVYEYEKNNVNTIKKLKRIKTLESKKIRGALKQTINAHGPITENLIPSATKRIYGAMLTEEVEKTFLQKILTFLR